MTRSAELFEEAKRYIPGGVNSPVRAFAAIGDCPRFIAKAAHQSRALGSLAGADLLQPLHQGCHVTGLHHQILHTQVGYRHGYVICNKPGSHQTNRWFVHPIGITQDADAIPFGQHQIQHQDVRLGGLQQAHRFLPICGGTHQVVAIQLLQLAFQVTAKRLAAVRDQNLDPILHEFPLLQSV